MKFVKTKKILFVFVRVHFLELSFRCLSIRRLGTYDIISIYRKKLFAFFANANVLLELIIGNVVIYLQILMLCKCLIK